MKAPRPRILLVDDDENFLASLTRLFGRTWDLVTATGGETGLEALGAGPPFAVVVSDFHMPHMDGIQFLAAVRERAPQTIRMMLTGGRDLEIAAEAVNAGHIFRFLSKPCPPAQIQRAIEDCLEQYRLIRTKIEAREQETRIAAEIQRSLLIEPPPQGLIGADIAALTTPSSGADGDFLDFFDHSPTLVDVVVGDVMGKGILAALTGAGAKTRFARLFQRLLTREDRGGPPPSPQRIMRLMQQETGTRLMDLGSFITLFYGRFDLVGRRLTFVDAGHTPIFHLAGQPGGIHLLKGGGSPLGFPQLSPYEEMEVPFSPGDTFLIYSDGLTDGRNAAGEMFGAERLQETFQSCRVPTAQAHLDGLMAVFQAFIGREPLRDDLSSVLVTIAG